TCAFRSPRLCRYRHGHRHPGDRRGRGADRRGDLRRPLGRLVDRGGDLRHCDLPAPGRACAAARPAADRPAPRHRGVAARRADDPALPPARDAMTDILALASLTKRFHAGTPSETVALRGVDLALGAGDFVTIIGSNGAGKSTLLKTVAGMIAPDAGTIRFEGRDITSWPVHRRAAVIGRIAQDPGDSTCAPMTIEENLAMAERRGMRRGL